MASTSQSGTNSWAFNSATFGDPDAEDDEWAGEQNEESKARRKDCVIFLIDAADSMFQEVTEQAEVDDDEIDDDTDAPHREPFRGTAFDTALRCVIEFQKEKIITSPDDHIGVVLYNTRETKNAQDFQHVYVFHPLDQPDAQRIKEVKELMNRAVFDARVGRRDPASPFQFSFALWACMTMFANATTQFGFRRIMIHTNNDAPNTDESYRNQAIQKARDLAELGIDLEMFASHPAPPAPPFDGDKFFRSIITLDEDEDTGRFRVGACKHLSEITGELKKKVMKKRVYGTLPLTIGPDINVSLSMYHLVVEAKKPSPIQLDSRENKPLKSNTSWFCEGTGSTLNPDDIRYYFPIGGERVYFTKEDMVQIKGGDKLEPGAKLLGFKPLSKMPVENITHAVFVYPNEADISGSNTLFAALHAKMLEMKRFAIIRVVARKGSTRRFDALYPLQEKLDENGAQEVPPGFLMIQLPFADDVRELQIDTVPHAPQEAVTAAKTMIKRLRLPNFHPRNFANPVLQQYFAGLEAMALDDDLDDINMPKDELFPDTNAWQHRAPLITAFADAALGPQYTSTLTVRAAAGAKRARDDSSAPGSAPKRARTAGDAAAAKAQVAALVADGKLGKSTVAQLKELAAAMGVNVPSRAKKADYLAALQAAVA